MSDIDRIAPVAWGLPNSAITGHNQPMMMVRPEVPSDDQYGGAMWVPLYDRAAIREYGAIVREECAKVADANRALIPDHNPDAERDDLVAQGYGNAALNIAVAIRNANKG